MKARGLCTYVTVGLMSLTILAIRAKGAAGEAAGEYTKHFEALRKLSVAVAEAMPAKEYGFHPHPESMDFGALMSHIATTNYQFCAGLKDSSPPALPSPTEKDAVVKFLAESFEYCGAVIPTLTEEQLTKAHDSPDGHLPGREILLAMYVHVAHHRGQAEIYLRDKGIRPPSYSLTCEDLQDCSVRGDLTQRTQRNRGEFAEKRGSGNEKPRPISGRGFQVEGNGRPV